MRNARNVRELERGDVGARDLDHDPTRGQTFRAGDVVTEKGTGKRYVVEHVQTRRIILPPT